MKTLPEQMYADLKTILPDLQLALEQGIQYGGDLFHRFVWYDIVVHSALPIITICLLFFLRTIFRLVWEKTEHIDDFNQDRQAARLIIATVLFSATVGLVCVSVYNLSIITKDMLIPEVRVIEVLSNL